MRSKWGTFFVIICGGALGSLIGEVCRGFKPLAWFGQSKAIGLSVNDPALLDLIFFKLRFGISFEFSIATLVFMFIALIIYKKLF